MADDVRIATGLRHHRKTKRLRRALGAEGCWSLVCLFLWAGEQRWSGDLSGLTDDDIEDEADWRGEPGALVAALIELRFLTGSSGHRKIHEWEEHNPYAAAKGARIAKGKAAVNARWERERQRREQEAAKASIGAGDDTPSIPPASYEDTATTGEKYPPAPAPAPAPAPSLPTGESIATPAAPPQGGGIALVGAFEGHENPQVPAYIGKARKAAIELSKLGHPGTAANEGLLAYFREGGSVEHIMDCARQPGSDGKHIGYLAAFARRELHAVAPPVADGSHPSRNPQTAQGAGARAADSIKRTVERHGLDID